MWNQSDRGAKMHKVIHLIVGARPNFMKIAPLYRALACFPDKYSPMIIHTGQHYDEKMSKLFFEDLRMPAPYKYLHVGSGLHGQQTARIIERYEEFVLNDKLPDMVFVAGDVNSTFACALVAKKLHVPVAHLEAGLRSFDDRMPEEINRVLTDRISDLLLTPSLDANENLHREGVPKERIHFVGNIMIDSLVEHIEMARHSNIQDNLGLSKTDDYALVTLHRPSNVDTKEGLQTILSAFAELSNRIKIIFPMHPRTLKSIQNMDLGSFLEINPNMIVTEPLGYLDFLKLQIEAKLILTDSGGIQEESTFLGIPCLTLRESTERPITITQGTNQLVDLETNSIIIAADMVLSGQHQKGTIPEKWDGDTAQRVVIALDNWFCFD